LQRLLVNDWVKAEWRQTENNRRARYYRLTASGRRQLETQSENFDRLIGAIARVMAAV
jgi:DNA-binding PadR family transcriptional regulator